MFNRYISRLAAARLVIAVIVITVFCLVMELWAAARLAENRLQRQLLFMATVCPDLQAGQTLISTVQTGEPQSGPSTLTCIYSPAPTYGQATRRHQRQFQ